MSSKSVQPFPTRVPPTPKKKTKHKENSKDKKSSKYLEENKLISDLIRKELQETKRTQKMLQEIFQNNQEKFTGLANSSKFAIHMNSHSQIAKKEKVPLENNRINKQEQSSKRNSSNNLNKRNNQIRGGNSEPTRELLMQAANLYGKLKVIKHVSNENKRKLMGEHSRSEEAKKGRKFKQMKSSSTSPEHNKIIGSCESLMKFEIKIEKIKKPIFQDYVEEESDGNDLCPKEVIPKEIKKCKDKKRLSKRGSNLSGKHRSFMETTSITITPAKKFLKTDKAYNKMKKVSRTMNTDSIEESSEEFLKEIDLETCSQCEKKVIAENHSSLDNVAEKQIELEEEEVNINSEHILNSLSFETVSETYTNTLPPCMSEENASQNGKQSNEIENRETMDQNRFQVKDLSSKNNSLAYYLSFTELNKNIMPIISEHNSEEIDFSESHNCENTEERVFQQESENKNIMPRISEHKSEEIEFTESDNCKNTEEQVFQQESENKNITPKISEHNSEEIELAESHNCANTEEQAFQQENQKNTFENGDVNNSDDTKLETNCTENLELLQVANYDKQESNINEVARLLSELTKETSTLDEIEAKILKLEEKLNEQERIKEGKDVVRIKSDTLLGLPLESTDPIHLTTLTLKKLSEQLRDFLVDMNAL